MDHFVVRTIAIDDKTFVPRHFADEACPVELIAKTQLRCPLEDKEDCVGRFDVEREIECWQNTRTAIKHDLVPQFFAGADIVMNILCAPGVFGDKIHEHYSHQ